MTMEGNKPVYSLTVRKRAALTLIIALGVLLAMAHGQQPPKTAAAPTPHSGKAPVVDIDAPETSNENLRAHRAKRATVIQGEIPEIKESNLGSMETRYAHIFENSLPRSPIPVTEVSAIVIGDVVNAEAVVPPHKTAIYSEFSIHVTEILKQSDIDPINVGGVSEAIRYGGTVRFPSGRTERYTYHHYGFPKTGSVYLFFLWRHPEGGYFVIYTAYQIQAEKIFPLDDEQGFKQYEGSDAALFIKSVREKISAGQSSGGAK